MRHALRGRVLSVIVVAAVMLLAPRLPRALTWAVAGVGAAALGALLVVTRRFRRARALLASGRYELAAEQLTLFEAELTRSRVAARVASFGVGSWTRRPLAASKSTLGAVRFEQGRFDEAKALFEAALAVDPSYPLPHVNLAALAAKRGDDADARRHRERAEALGWAPERRRLA